MTMNLSLERALAMTRRQFFGGAGLGLGSIALGSLLERESRATTLQPENPLAPKKSMHPAKAKAVIYLHMAGSPSQVDLFEHKPALGKFHGKDCPKEYLEGKRFAFIKGVPKMLGPLFHYEQHGQSGQWISELLPHFSSIVDDVCVIRSMHTDQFNHAPAQLLHAHRPTAARVPQHGFVGDLWPWQREPGPAGFCGALFRRQNAGCRQERVGQRFLADGLSGSAMPHAMATRCCSSRIQKA